MEITGKIKMISTTQEVSASFKKRDVVVTTNDQYPQDILIQFVQDKCSVLDGYNLGENVTIGINLRGREWTDPQGLVKYFNTIQGWNIKRLVQVQSPSQAYVAQQTEQDLPF